MFEPPRETWTFFGKHQHRYELPDIYVCRMNGDVSGPDMLAQLDALRWIHQRTKRGIYWICDVRAMGTLSPEARKAAAAASSTDLRTVLCGSAVFGAAFGTRVMVTLLARATRLLNPSRARPIAFVETEAQAWAFINELRRAENRPSVTS